MRGEKGDCEQDFMGHTTEIAHRGQEALALLGGGLKVDLVILDWYLRIFGLPVCWRDRSPFPVFGKPTRLQHGQDVAFPDPR